MKKFFSRVETEWFEDKFTGYTPEDQAIIDSNDHEAIAAIGDKYEKLKYSSATKEDAASLSEFYSFLKTQLAKNNSYALISVNIEKEGDKSIYGIINYRLDGEHKQHRF